MAGFSIKEIFSNLGQKLRFPARRYPWMKHYPVGVAWDAELKPCLLTDFLDQAEQTYGDQVAVEFMEKTMTYRELAAQSRRLAASLQAMGVGKGVRVGLFLPNSPHFIVSYYAILRAGGTVVNFNPLYPVEDITKQIRDAGVEIMLTFGLKQLYGKLLKCREESCLRTVVVADFSEALPSPKSFLFKVVKWRDRITVKRKLGDRAFLDLLQADAQPTPVEIDLHEDVAVLQYTGGTTGIPKGAMLTHANLSSNVQQCALWFHEMEAGKEVMMGVLPLFHVFAMTVVMNLSIAKGFRMILHPQFELKKLLVDVATKRPTIMPGVPTMFNAINNHEALDGYDLTSLKFCISGGASLPREVREKFELKTGCSLVEGYGLSETSPVACVNPIYGLKKGGSIGLPLPDTIIEIVEIEGKRRVLGVGKTGEICIRGPQVMKGYAGRPEETANVLQEGGRLHTGDIGYIDAEGYVFVIDRLKEMIISGGYNVYPRHVEEVLYSHPDVTEAAVIGIEHEHWGQVVKAYVVKREGSDLDSEALLEYLRPKLPRFAQPSEIEFRDELPKTMIGKISKKDL